MKRIILLSFSLLFIFLTALQAQDFSYTGFQAGMTLSRMPFTYDNLIYNEPVFDSTSFTPGSYEAISESNPGRWLIGANAGVVAGKEFTRTLGARLEFNYTQMGRADTVNFNQRTTFKAHYLEASPMVQFNLTPNSPNKFYVLAGPSVRFLISTDGQIGNLQSASVNAGDINFVDSLSFLAALVPSIPTSAPPASNELEIKQLDYGVNLGLSYMIQLSPYLYMNLGVRGYYGLTTINENAGTSGIALSSYASSVNSIQNDIIRAVTLPEAQAVSALESAAVTATELSTQLSEEGGVAYTRKLTNQAIMFQVGFTVPLRPRGNKLIKIK